MMILLAHAPCRDDGSDESDRTANLPREDFAAQLNAETFVSTLGASNPLVMQQLGAYLENKDEHIAGLQLKLRAF